MSQPSKRARTAASHRMCIQCALFAATQISGLQLAQSWRNFRAKLEHMSLRDSNNPGEPPINTFKHSFLLGDFNISCTYQTPGEVFTCGEGDCGQLGKGPDFLESNRPKRVDYFAGIPVLHVECGGMHNLALDSTYRLHSWGCNDQKALGRSGEETLPGLVEGLEGEKIVAMKCGDSFSVCLTEKGRVYIWGTFRKSTGIFGLLPSEQVQERPHLLDGVDRVVHMGVGSNHAILIDTNGNPYSIGVGEQGQLGRKIMPRQEVDSSLKARNMGFRPYKLSKKFARAYCGAYHSFLVHENGHSVFAFGLNNYGQLGVGFVGSADGEEGNHVDKPTLVVGLPNDRKVVSIAAGEHHSMILLDDGSVYSFGRGDSNQLGHGTEESLATPRRIAALPNSVTHVSCGSAFSIALTSENGDNLFAWGYGDMGQLMTGEDQDEPLPTRVDLRGRKVIMANAGGQHTCIVVGPKV